MATKTHSGLTLTELGCGTARNTIRFLAPPLSESISSIHALDLSPAMLEIARSRCATFIAKNDSCPSIQFYEFNALDPQNCPGVSHATKGKADLVISTLVLEHLPISSFS